MESRTCNNKLSNIDLVISKSNDASIVNIEVYDESYEYDHFPIKIIVFLNKFIYRKRSFEIRSTQIDWEAVDKVLESRYLKFFDLSYDNSPASQKYKSFVEIVRGSIEKCTAKRKNVEDEIHINPEWWDEECSKFKRLRRAAFKKWRFSKKFKDRVEFKRSCAIMKRVLKKNKKSLLHQIYGVYRLK